jgi:hypothetical protein
MDSGCHPEEWGTIHFFLTIMIWRIWRILLRAQCCKHDLFKIIAAWYLPVKEKQVYNCILE